MGPAPSILRDLVLRMGLGSTKAHALEASMIELERLRQRMELPTLAGQGDIPFFPLLKWGQAWGQILPLECAILYAGANTQAIGTGAWTPLTTWDPIAVGSGSGASRELGLRADASDGKIYVSGVSRQSVVLWIGQAVFVANATGLRGVAMEVSDTSWRQFVLPTVGAGMTTMAWGVHIRSVKDSESWYRPYVYQSSGGDLVCQEYLHAVVRVH